MTHDIYQLIQENKAAGRKMLAILLDPDKCSNVGQTLFESILNAQPDFVFVGGSVVDGSVDNLVRSLKQRLPFPVLLFPGDARQFTPNADALLLLSLISGRNPDLLIGQHVNAAMAIKRSAIEVIPTGYILIDGGRRSAVERVSHTQPLPADCPEMVVATAVAAQLLGMKMVYLEAGSGALTSVSPAIIREVAAELSIPLIVGGGIRTIEQINDALSAGADLLVIGNHFETHPEDMLPFAEAVRSYRF